MGEWEPCSAACGGGTRRRSVTCVDSFTLLPAIDTRCSSGNRPASESSCNNQICDLCSSSWLCKPPSFCAMGNCICVMEHTGERCEIPEGCESGIDRLGRCCGSGGLSRQGECCGPGASQGGDGDCCRSGHVDACGNCDGPYQVTRADFPDARVPMSQHLLVILRPFVGIA